MPDLLPSAVVDGLFTVRSLDELPIVRNGPHHLPAVPQADRGDRSGLFPLLVLKDKVKTKRKCMTTGIALRR